jgi:cytochrome P450
VITVSDLDLPAFDYSAPDLTAEAYHRYLADARKQNWLARSPMSGLVLVLDREAGEFFLRSKGAAFPGREIADATGVTCGRARDLIDGNLLNDNGDSHRRLRAVIQQSLSPQAADRWRPAMRNFLAQLWSGIEPATNCEFVTEFSRPYQSLIMAAMFGAPAEDAARLDLWAIRARQQFDPGALANELELAEIERASAEVHEYLEALFEQQQTAPSDSLIASLLMAEAQENGLSRRENVDLAVNLVTAGIGPAQSALTLALRLFAEHPDQWALLAQQPELTAQAVSEVLRYEPVVPFIPRVCLEQVEHRGVIFPKGTTLGICTERANREHPIRRGPMSEQVDSECFDITVSRENKILTFGIGAHYCLGVHVARAQLEEALRFLAPRMQSLTLDGEPEVGGIRVFHEIKALPLRWAVDG